MVAKMKVRYPLFSRQLQAAAKKQGLKIPDLKRGLDVTYEMARRYWEGISMPRPDRMRVLATLVDVPAGELLGDDATEAREGAGAYKSSALDEEATEVARAFQYLSPAQREFYKGQIFRDARAKPRGSMAQDRATARRQLH